VHFAVCDIETRVDKPLLRAVLYRHEALGDHEAYERARREAGSGRRREFLPLAFHVPVSIVIGDVNDARVLTGMEVLGADVHGEAGIVTRFWERLEHFRGTLVTFNGRVFDLPVLELAALRHGCRIPHYFERGFRRRHSEEPHYDLYEFVTNAGTYGIRGGLDLLARLIALPGKGEVDGASVQTLWEAGRFDEVHRYCRRDVIQTYFLFLGLGPEQHAAALTATAAFRAELAGAS
jgi:hypothetical protein